MKFVQVLAVAAVFSGAGSVWAQPGAFMPPGSMSAGAAYSYQPSMQPGAYMAPPPQGPGEHAAYQGGGSMNCNPRGGFSAVEGPIANGALIDPTGGGRRIHN